MVGLPLGTDWNHPDRPAIWDTYASEGRTVDAIRRVLKARFLVDPSDPDADATVPYFSKEVAGDIKAVRLVPEVLTSETCDRGLLPIALQPRTDADIQSAIEDEDRESLTRCGDEES